MKFRKNVFMVLALLVVIGACLWATAFQEKTTELDTTDPAESEAEQTGRDLGEGAGYLLIACFTIPFFALFSLLAWRNSVGLRTERRHKEQLEAMKHLKQF